MTSAVERREHVRRYSLDRSESPIRTRHSPRRRSSPRKERSPIHQRTPPRTRSPPKSGPSHRTRSPPKEKLSGRARSPKHVRQRSPIRASSSRSPSPRIKRLRRVQAEQEPEKTAGQEHGRNPSREDRDKGRQREYKETGKNSPRSLSPRSKRLMRVQAEKSERITERDHGRHASREDRDRGRHGERGEGSDVPSERRSGRDKNEGGSSKSSRRDRSISPDDRNHRSKRASRSPPRASRAGARDEATRTRVADQTGDGELDSVAKMKAAEESLDAKSKDKQKPSFELSGKLAEETNRVRGVTLLFNEPPDARKPDVRWRLYVFKAGEVLNEPLYIHRQSCYLFGRERRVADIPTDHPSCSKQHAVIQYRLVEKEQPDGLLSKQVRAYLMDLGSTNGTFINDSRIEAQRYYELFEKDTIRFGNSSREYVILHENSME